MDIGVIGVGNMGEHLAASSSLVGKVRVYDIDSEKAEAVASKLGITFLNDIEGLLKSDIIFLAIPGNSVIPLLKENLKKSGPKTLWINVSTLVSIKDIKEAFPASKNIGSIKIIGEAGAMHSGTKPVIIVDPLYKNVFTEDVHKILNGVGDVIVDYELKYLNINLYAAEVAMLSCLSLAKKLSDNGIDNKVINAAVKGVLVGTSRQFPYENPDYFHELVYQIHPDIKAQFDTFRS